MIQLELHTEQLMHGLALHRFSVHSEEVRRALTPILNEVYQIGYERGIADHMNGLLKEAEESQKEIEVVENIVPELPSTEPVSTEDHLDSK